MEHLVKIAGFLRHLRIKRELDRRLRDRKAARQVRAESAARGVSTYWRNTGQRTRDLFGQ